MFVHSDFVLKAGMRVFIENCKIDIFLFFISDVGPAKRQSDNMLH